MARVVLFSWRVEAHAGTEDLMVLASVAIVMTAPRLLGVALALGGVATLLMLNGFFLLLTLPGGD